MAFTKKQKGDMTAHYEKWLSESQAVYVLDYTKMTMKEVDAFRAKARENGSEIHLVKNTLFTHALESQGYPVPDIFDGTSLVFCRHRVADTTTSSRLSLEDSICTSKPADSRPA